MGSISNILSGLFITPASQTGAGSNNQLAPQTSSGSDSLFGEAFMLSLSQIANGDGTDTDTTLGAGFESSPGGSAFIAARISGNNNATSAYEQMLSLLGIEENSSNTIGDNASNGSDNTSNTSETPIQRLLSEMAPAASNIEEANLASMAQNEAQAYNQMEQTYGPNSDFGVSTSLVMTPGETSETISISTSS